MPSSPIALIQEQALRTPPPVAWLPVLAVAATVTVLHLLTNGRYGFHRDELQFLYDARHLDWGFVAYPPMTPFIENLSMHLFGLSLVGLRLASVLAQAIVIVVSGLMASDFGGNRLAQFTAALAVALSPLPIFEGTEFQYTSFALLWWILAVAFTIRLLKTGNPRWWVAIGAALGFGLLTKYSIAFFIAGLLIGLVLTSARRYLASPWFWAGVAVAMLLFTPNFIWLVRHDFISYQFLQHIHARDVAIGRAAGFLKGQFLANANLFAAPLWITGLACFFLSNRYRMLAWMYVVPVVIFWINKGRFYYVAEAYPPLIAMGAVAAAIWLARQKPWQRIALEAIFFTGVVAVGAFAIAMLVPVTSTGRLRDFALSKSRDLREEFGWNELVRTVAGIRDSLTPQQQAHLGITVGNYGEAGAIEILGPAYHLPHVISTTNTGWLVGYPSDPPTTIIALGITQEEANTIFTGCRLAGHNGNSEGIRNEESEDHLDIFLCGPPRKPWAEVWKEHKDFG